jgi:hypothetical protein
MLNPLNIKAYSEFITGRVFCIHKASEFVVEIFDVDAKKSRNRTSTQDPIGYEMILHCTLQFFSSASYLNVMTHTGISRAAFYSCVYRE